MEASMLQSVIYPNRECGKFALHPFRPGMTGATLVLFLLLLAVIPPSALRAQCPPGLQIYNLPVTSQSVQCCYELSVEIERASEDPIIPCSVAVYGLPVAPIWQDEYYTPTHTRHYIPYCIPPNSSRTVSVVLYDCGGDTLCSFSENLYCPPCCDGLNVQKHITYEDSYYCCGEFRITQNPNSPCEVHSVEVTGATRIWDPAIQGYRVPFCVAKSNPQSIIVEALDINGHVLCSTALLAGCSTLGGPWPKQGETGESRDTPATLSVTPNPAGDVAIARYELPVDAHVTLDLHNMLGERILVLENSSKQQGIHTVTVNTAALPAGMYMLKLSYDNGVLSIPVTVSR